MDYFNTISIEQTDLGDRFHNLMNQFKTFDLQNHNFLVVTVKEVPAKGEQFMSTGIHFQKKTVERIQMSHQNRQRLSHFKHF